MTHLTHILALDSSTKLSNPAIRDNREDIITDITNLLVLKVVRHPVLADLIDENPDIANNYMLTLESLCRNRVNARVNFSTGTVERIQFIIEEVEKSIEYSDLHTEHHGDHTGVERLIRQGLMLFLVVLQLQASHEKKHSESETVQKVLSIFNKFYFSHQTFNEWLRSIHTTDDLFHASREHKYFLSAYGLDSYYNSLKATFNRYNANAVLSTISRIK